MISLSSLLAVLTLTGGLSESQVFQRSAAGNAAPLVSGTSQSQGRLFCRIDQGEWRQVADIPAGPWRAALPSLPTGGPYTLQLRLSSAAGPQAAIGEVTVREVFVGDLWVLAGQSNMVGRAAIDDSENLPDPRVRMYSMEGQWQVAKHAIHERRGRQGHGLGLEFGKEMVKSHQVPIGLIPCARGGTSMEQWSPALASEGPASLYGNLLERVRKTGGQITGVLWYQGENDTGAQAAAVYQATFQDFIARLRADLDRPDLPFYYAQLARYASKPSGTRYYSDWNTVQEAQRISESEVPHVRMVATIDLEMGDLIHLNRESLDRLGKRFARAVQGQAGPRLLDIRWTSPREIRIRLTGINGALQAPGGRVFGFEATTPGGEPLALFYRAAIDPQTGEIVLSANQFRDLPAEVDLWYGRGYDPICNLTDEADLALPVFGPVRLPPRPGEQPPSSS